MIPSKQNFIYNTTFRSHECFKAFDSERIEICLGCNINTKIISQEQASKYASDDICLTPTFWDIEIDTCLTTISNFLEICLKEFISKGFLNCKKYDLAVVCGNVEQLDIKYDAMTKFSAATCFKEFDKRNIKMCLDKSETQIVIPEKFNECENACVPLGMWQIENAGCVKEDDYFDICMKEFEHKHFTPCTTQQQPEEQNIYDWSLIEKSVAGVMVVGIVTLIGAILFDFSANINAPLLIGGETEGV